MKKVLLVDYSVMMHASWYQMFSPNYQASNPEDPLELNEYTTNLAKNLLFLKLYHKPDEIIFCLDDPTTNWRAHFIRGYYDNLLNLYRDNSPESQHQTFITVIDGQYWKMEKFVAMGQWKKSKTSEKEVNLLDVNRYHQIDKSQIKVHEVWDACMENLIPYYKANRKFSEWKGKVSKSDWKKKSFELSKSMASLVGAHVITIPFAEGDDVIATALMYYANEESEVVIVSTDHDMYQLFTIHPRLSIWNPVHHKTVILDPDRARWELLCKIAGGDTSDNLNGVVVDGKEISTISFFPSGEVKSGKKIVSKLLSLIQDNLDNRVTGSELYKPAYDWLEANAELDSFQKNLHSVYFKNIPDTLQERIRQAIIYSEPENDPEMSWLKVGVTQADRISLSNKVQNELNKVFENAQ